MKRIVLGLMFASMVGIAQASMVSIAQTDTATLEIANRSEVTFSNYDGQPRSVTGAQSSGFWGSLFTTGVGVFSATYLGNESGYVNQFSFGLGGSELLESQSLGTTISMWVDGGTVNFSFSDNAGSGHVFNNGDQQGNPFGFAIMKGQTNIYGTFDYLLGFNDSFTGDADYDDFVVGINFVAAVPEPETYAMLLTGLGLLGMSLRGRKSGRMSV